VLNTWSKFSTLYDTVAGGTFWHISVALQLGPGMTSWATEHYKWPAVESSSKSGIGIRAQPWLGYPRNEVVVKLCNVVMALNSWNDSWKKMPYYLGQFNITYIIFRNVESFKSNVFQITKYGKGKYWIFRNTPFAEMNLSKLINYSRDMCWNGQATTVFIKMKTPFSLAVTLL